MITSIEFGVISVFELRLLHLLSVSLWIKLCKFPKPPVSRL